MIMEKDLVKRFVTKDGKQRVSIYQDEYAENPRYGTDEPLHCEDWDGKYSIMTKQERESKSSSARDLIIYLLESYGKREAIINMLIENGKHMTDGKSVCKNALVYEHSMRIWVLKQYTKWGWNDGKYDCWNDAEYFAGRKDDIELSELLEACLDSTIDELCDKKYWTDGIKMCSYRFGYNGEVKFYEGVTCDVEGIAWLEKNEFLKYSGCKDEYWKGKSLKDIMGTTEELEAWCDNEVYGFAVEKAVRTITNVRYPDGEHDDTEHEEIVWEKIDSCWGFYGELNKSLEWILGSAGFKKDELIEM